MTKYYWILFCVVIGYFVFEKTRSPLPSPQQPQSVDMNHTIQSPNTPQVEWGRRNQQPIRIDPDAPLSPAAQKILDDYRQSEVDFHQRQQARDTVQTTTSVCPSCNGSGTGRLSCHFCGGRGNDGHFKCSFCNGRGLDECSRCSGMGRITQYQWN